MNVELYTCLPVLFSQYRGAFTKTSRIDLHLNMTSDTIIEHESEGRGRGLLMKMTEDIITDHYFQFNFKFLKLHSTINLAQTHVPKMCMQRLQADTLPLNPPGLKYVIQNLHQTFTIPAKIKINKMLRLKSYLQIFKSQTRGHFLMQHQNDAQMVQTFLKSRPCASCFL